MHPYLSKQYALIALNIFLTDESKKLAFKKSKILQHVNLTDFH